MRRSIATLVVLMLCASMIAPSASATITGAHACCRKAPMSMQHHHCAGMMMQGSEVAPAFFHASSNRCDHRCCLGLTFTTQSSAGPRAFSIANAPDDPHPFLTEFYPSASSTDEVNPQAERAPPSSASAHR